MPNSDIDEMAPDLNSVSDKLAWGLDQSSHSLEARLGNFPNWEEKIIWAEAAEWNMIRAKDKALQS